jgi:hypothetical protein
VPVEKTPHEATVAASDIARLASVSKAAVSNWRRRYPDFPAPVGGSTASPLFLLSAVEAWLAANGREISIEPADRLWQQLRGSVDDLHLGDALGGVGSALLLHDRAERHWRRLAAQPDANLAAALEDAIMARLPGLPGGSGAEWNTLWTPLLRSAVDAARAEGSAAVFDRLVERYYDLHGRQLTPTAPETAALMAQLVVAGGTILDPACGAGGLLLAAHRAVSTTEGTSAIRLLGHEINPTTARLAAVRLMLAGVEGQISTADALHDPPPALEPADAILCDPPTGGTWAYHDHVNDPRWRYGLPPRTEPELAWVQHCLDRLRPGAYAAVLMPPAAAVRRSGRRIRGNLLRGGALRAVISHDGTDLWLLQRPIPDAPGQIDVLFAAETDSAAVVDAWQVYRSGTDRAREPAEYIRRVPIIELLDDEVDLAPGRNTATVSQALSSTGFPQVRDALAAAIQRMAMAIPDFVATGGTSLPATTTLGELLRAGTVTVHQAPSRMTTDDGDTPVLMQRDVRRDRPPSGRTGDTNGTVGLRTGDIIMSATVNGTVVRVFTSGEAVLGPQLLLYRARLDQLDPYFLAGFLTAFAQSGEGRPAGGSSRSAAHRTVLPRLPLAQQRAYGAAFLDLMKLDAEVRAVAEHAQTLLRLGFAGLSAGDLAPHTGEA